MLQEKEQRKKGCQWLLVSHDPVEAPQLVLGGENEPRAQVMICSPSLPQESVLHAVLPQSGCVFFKFEPFVLHVMCATLQDARLMVRRVGWGGGGWVCLR